jgi:hypothetical protein
MIGTGDGSDYLALQRESQNAEDSPVVYYTNCQQELKVYSATASPRGPLNVL